MKNKTNKRQNKKQFTLQKSTIKLDWFELLDLKYVLRNYLCKRFKFRNELRKLNNFNDSFDIILVNDRRMIQLYKEIIKKVNNYE